MTAGEPGADEEVSLARCGGDYSCCFPASGISRLPLRPAEVQPNCSHFPSGRAGETRAAVRGRGGRRPSESGSSRAAVPAVHVPGRDVRVAAPTAGARRSTRSAQLVRPRPGGAGVARAASSTWPREPRCRPPVPVPVVPATHPPRHATPPHLSKNFSLASTIQTRQRPTAAANHPGPSNKVPAVERAPLGVRKVMS